MAIESVTGAAGAVIAKQESTGMVAGKSSAGERTERESTRFVEGESHVVGEA
jgi:hypothetical protein